MPEDVLDCPFIDLELLQIVGERPGPSGRREQVLRFRRGRKPDVTDGVFAFCLPVYWRRFHTNEETLDAKALISGRYAVGRALQLDDEDVWHRLTKLESRSNGAFRFEPSAALPRVVRRTNLTDAQLEWAYDEAQA